ELRALSAPAALAQVEGQLRSEPRTPDELHDLLRRRGDLRADEYPEDLAEPLLAERRAVHVRVAGEQRLIAAEDAGRYRDAVGAMPPGGLPEVFLEADEKPLESLLRRYARSRGPFTSGQANAHFGHDVEPVLRELERRDELVRGELRPGGTEREVHKRLRAALGRSALFWYDLLADTGLEAEEALPVLWDLVWAGEITNDAWTPLRAGRRYQAKGRAVRARRFSRRRVGEITATQGRWSPTARLFTGRPDRRALAELLLERQG